MPFSIVLMNGEKYFMKAKYTRTLFSAGRISSGISFELSWKPVLQGLCSVHRIPVHFNVWCIVDGVGVVSYHFKVRGLLLAAG